MNRIYADHNATTPLAPEVLAAMLPYLREHHGNPSSVHFEGREARAALDDARARIAALLGATEGEIIFTSGGTESCNAAIFGVVRAREGSRPHLITSAIEHSAVREACARLAQRGEARVTYLPVDARARVDPAALAAAIREDTVLVSIMAANNETGTVQPIRDMAAICRDRGVTFHTDAVQAFGKIPLNVSELGVDLLSIAAHKVYGPKGVGSLYLRRGTPFQPPQVGGAHEHERRAGTENVAGIVGLAAAAERVVAKMESEQARLRALTEQLADRVRSGIADSRVNGHLTERIANTVNFSFGGCDANGLLLGLDLEGIAVSSGSACAVGSLRPSHVLQAMGLPDDLAKAAVRVSLGESNTEEEVDRLVAAVKQVVERLRMVA